MSIKSNEEIAHEAYSIYRGSLRDEKTPFPLWWGDLPQHLRDLMTFIVSHSQCLAEKKLDYADRQVARLEGALEAARDALPIMSSEK